MDFKNHELYSKLRIGFLVVWLLLSFGITWYLIGYLQDKAVPIELNYRDLAAIFAALVASGTLIFHGMNVHLTVRANFEKLNFDKENYYSRYSFYIKVRREKAGSLNIFDTFEQVALDWQKKKLG